MKTFHPGLRQSVQSIHDFEQLLRMEGVGFMGKWGLVIALARAQQNVMGNPMGSGYLGNVN